MLSRKKQTLLAAAAALTVVFGTAGMMQSANAQGQPQIERQDGGRQSGETRSRGEMRSGGEMRQGGREGRSGGEIRSDRPRDTTTTRSSVRDRDGDRDRSRISVRDRDRDGDRSRVSVRHRDRDWDHDRWRGRHSYGSVSFVILGPRTVYRSYGSGWCRALHNGRHWAPRIGWHRGRHVGAVRCG